MVRILAIAFLIAHGLVHLAIWATPPPADRTKMPFDVRHSWLIGEQKRLALAVALVATALLVTAGVALWAHAAWWRPVAFAGLSTSFALIVLFFHPWFLFIEAVNLGLVVALGWLDWPSRAALGA